MTCFCPLRSAKWWGVLWLAPVSLWASGEGQRIDFRRDIRPLLSNRCFACHGPDEEQRKGGLRLDTVEGARADLGGGYAAIVPGKPEESELIYRLTAEDRDEVMPPPGKGERLSEQEIARMRTWIAQGAAYDTHWSYTAPVKVEPPSVREAGWPVNEIDRFLLGRLEREGLKPAAEADRKTLARRLMLDLTGLPPSWEEVTAFERDVSPGAWVRLVEAALRKPGFGEHWARWWLDQARYADSSGYPSDQPREIWGYRDWVIEAFNRNLPFDRFTVEQIAGDLLANPSEDQIIATAFHRNTMTQNEGGTSDEEFRVAAVIDRVNTTMEVWMGTTMACAQCHSHKFDPISQAEYFQVYAMLNQTEDADRKEETPLHSFFPAADRERRAGLEREAGELEARFASPDPSWLTGLDAWDAQFPRDLTWNRPKPDQAVTAPAAGSASIGGDGTVTIGKNADTAVHTVELPLAAGSLSAVRLETEPAPGFGNFVITALRAEVLPPEGAAGPAARFVRVELPGKAKFLQLAEVEVIRGGGNEAKDGRASHSSQYLDAEARRAIDGRTEGDYAKGSVSHTAQQDDPWWEVDLGAVKPVDRIVVWNRTDGGTGARLEGFRVVALDGNRNAVWKREAIPAPKDRSEFALGGPVPLSFVSAVADYEQAGFPAASLLRAPGKDAPGWAVGGAADRPHHLTLLLKSPFPVVEGARLRLTIEQNSSHKGHLLGRFRLAVTGDAAVARAVAIPAAARAALQLPAGKRDEGQRRAVVDYYVRNIAPESAADRARLAAARRELELIKPVTVPIMRELPAKDRRVTRIQRRGNWQDLGEEVNPGVPAAFHGLPGGVEADRLALAQWLVSRDNPLTARVIVNRFWEAIFGVGIVETGEEFGSQGDLPFHPELLDWLAVDFMEHGWDVKRLLQQFVLSRAYRQDSVSHAALNERDPDNRLLGRGPRFRPTGEQLRDQALSVAGLLSGKVGGPPVRPVAPALGLSTAFGRSNDWTTSAGEDRWRRSVYTEVRRNAPYASFTTFDAPNREVCTIRRGRTNTPLQAFVTLNDPVFVEASQGLARRLVQSTPPGEGASGTRLREAYRICLSREPHPAEVDTLTSLLAGARERLAADPAGAARLATEPLGAAPPGADLVELAAWTAVANVILNLDEFLMRR